MVTIQVAFYQQDLAQVESTVCCFLDTPITEPCLYVISPSEL